MFTGIIEELGRVKSIRGLKGGIELDVAFSKTEELEVDDSIAVNGVCQTVVKKKGDIFTIQAVEETLRKTTFDQLKSGDIVNLERSLTLQQRIDGHLVQGHVDTVGKVLSAVDEGANWLFEIEFPKEFAHLIVGRGSIAIDGISLTVARLKDQSFTVAIIPYTYEHTTLKNKKNGSTVNLEFDILGKYVARMLGTASQEKGGDKSEGVTKEMLQNFGFANS